MQHDAVSSYAGEKDPGPRSANTLQVDGGMTNNKLLMQLQADILGCTVRKQCGSCQTREIG